MATLESLAAAFAAYKEQTEKKLAMLEAETADLRRQLSTRPSTAGGFSRVNSGTLPKSTSKPGGKSGGLTPSQSKEDDVRSVNNDNYIKGKVPSAVVKRTSTVRSPSTESVNKDLDEKRIGSYMVGKRKVYYVMPEDYKKTSAEDQPVASDLKLQYVYGYNGKEASNNLFFNKQDEKEKNPRLVYSIAATGVVFNPQTKAQQFFNGHNEDILCLAIHPTQPVAATGQLDPKGRGKPYTCIWNYETMTELHRIEGFHDRGVCTASFSPDGKYLATVGNDDSHTVGIFEWESKSTKPVTQAMVAKDEVYGMSWNEHCKRDGYEFVCYGSKLLKIFHMAPQSGGKDPFTLKGNLLSSFGKTKIVQPAHHSAVFAADGELLVGTHTGELYVFKDGQYVKAIDAHKGSVGALIKVADGFISGGEDGHLKCFSTDYAPKWDIDLGKNKVKALDVHAHTNSLVVGASNNSILRVNLGSKGVETLQQGHHEEIWGCATHPSEHVFVTCANDKTVRAWDTDAKAPIPGKSVSFKSEAMCCNFSPDGKTIAVGFMNGNVALVDYDSFTVKYDKKHRGEQIAAIAFSPNGQLVGVGSWDQMAELIDVESKSSVTLKGHTSSVTHLTFSEDSKNLITNSRDYEILFWNCETGKRVDKTLTGDIKWWDFQCILGFPVRGIFGAGQDGTDNNAAHVSYGRKFVVTGNDTGEVTLFRYPASQKSAKKFIGHSSHVTNVRFTRDDAFVVSTGGNDLGIFLWAVVGAE